VKIDTDCREFEFADYRSSLPEGPTEKPMEEGAVVEQDTSSHRSESDNPHYNLSPRASAELRSSAEENTPQWAELG
jgi:hypothetical protein